MKPYRSITAKAVIEREVADRLPRHDLGPAVAADLQAGTAAHQRAVANEAQRQWRATVRAKSSTAAARPS